MPFFVLSAARAPLCAQCARAARRINTTSATLIKASTTTTTPPRRALSTRRPIVAASASARPSPRQARLLSSSARSAAPRGQTTDQQPSSTSSTSSSSSSTTPSTPSFYALFPKTFPLGAPPVGPFAVNVRALRTEFLQLQAAAHPDFHHAASQGGSSEAAAPESGNGHSTARARAEAMSSLINEAYRTLASPLLRAQYLLRQRFDVDLANDESTLSGGGGKDMELLMAVLEVREEIEQARSEEDLEPVRAANDARMRASEALLEEAFKADDAVAARREAVRLRYWVNIDDALRNWERGKDIVLEH